MAKENLILPDTARDLKFSDTVRDNKVHDLAVLIEQDDMDG